MSPHRLLSRLSHLLHLGRTKGKTGGAYTEPAIAKQAIGGLSHGSRDLGFLLGGEGALQRLGGGLADPPSAISMRLLVVALIPTLALPSHELAQLRVGPEALALVALNARPVLSRRVH